MHDRQGWSTPYTMHASQWLENNHQFSSTSSLLTECADNKRKVIEKQVHSTFPWCQIDKIRQVNHSAMYGMYLLRKEEMQLQDENSGNKVQEVLLYHVTTESKGVQSLKNGLDWRRTRRSKFGRGVSFSDNCDYANFYANFSSSEETRVIIVCTVLVANKWMITHNSGNYLVAPPGTADTTVSPNGRVYVKYYDYEFYPLYLVYYRCSRDDLHQSRYFNGKNGPRNKVNMKPNSVAAVTALPPQKQDEELQRAQQLLKEKMQRQSQQLEEQRLQQELKRQKDLLLRQRQLQIMQDARQRQQQQRNNQNSDNGCLIL